MFGSIGLALGAVSTLSSLLETAAAGITKAGAGTQPTGAQSASAQTFNPAAATTASAVQSYGAPRDTGVVLPKFDQHTQATLLAYQEMHRGG
jgi:hypothetical protein